MSKHPEDDVRVLPPPFDTGAYLGKNPHEPPTRRFGLQGAAERLREFGKQVGASDKGKPKRQCSWAVYYSSIENGVMFDTEQEVYRYLVHQLDNNQHKSLYWWKVAKITLDRAPEISDATRWMLRFADRQYRQEQAGVAH